MYIIVSITIQSKKEVKNNEIIIINKQIFLYLQSNKL